MGRHHRGDSLKNSAIRSSASQTGLILQTTVANVLSEATDTPTGPAQDEAEAHSVISPAAMKPAFRSIRFFCFSAFPSSVLPTVMAPIRCVLSAMPLVAQTTASNNATNAHKQAIANLLEELGRTPGQAEISPDGRTVAWVAPLGDSGSRIHLTPLNGIAARPRG